MEIKVYSRSGDPYSDMLKNILKFHSIDFDNIDVSRNKQALLEMKDISGQENTPVLVVDGKAFVGFDRERIKEVLGIGKDKTQESHSYS